MKKLILIADRRARPRRPAPRPPSGGIAWDKFPTDKLTDLAVAAERRQAVRQLLPELPFGARSCATTACSDIGLTERADQGQPAVRHRQGRRHDEGRDRPEAGQGMVRRVPPDLTVIARSRVGPRRHRRRLPLHLPAHLLPRRHQGRPAGTTSPSRTSACRTCCGSCRASAAPSSSR